MGNILKLKQKIETYETCSICDNIITDINYLECVRCNVNFNGSVYFHTDCYRNTINSQGIFNKDAGYTECPKCKHIGVIATCKRIRQ